MDNPADRVRAMRRQLASRVRDALDDASPELSESAIGCVAQAGVLVSIAAELLSEQLGPEAAAQLMQNLMPRMPASGERSRCDCRRVGHQERHWTGSAQPLALSTPKPTA